MKYLLIIKLVGILFTLPAVGQSIDTFEHGRYFENNGLVYEGLLHYDYSSSKIKFKSKEESKTKTLRPWDIMGFTIRTDTFTVLENFYFEAPGGGLHSTKIDFVQVLETGYITLYKHFTRFKSGGAPNSLITIERLENYIIKPRNSDSLYTLRKKNHKKFEKQINTLFKNFPEFTELIDKEKYDWESVPKLVNDFNRMKTAHNNGEHP